MFTMVWAAKVKFQDGPSVNEQRYNIVDKGMYKLIKEQMDGWWKMKRSQTDSIMLQNKDVTG